jgi:hypothetical protein
MLNADGSTDPRGSKDGVAHGHASMDADSMANAVGWTGVGPCAMWTML